MQIGQLIQFLVIICLFTYPINVGSSLFEDSCPVITTNETPDEITDMDYPPFGGEFGGFIENKGQFPDDKVSYYLSFSAGGIAFLEDAVILNKQEELDIPYTSNVDVITGSHGTQDPDDDFGSSPAAQGCNVQLTFPGGQISTPIGLNPIPGKFNFITGSQEEWATDVTSYSTIQYEDLFTNIDLVYTSTYDGIKSEFIVRPGGDINDIQVMVEGHIALSTHRNDLTIRTVAGDFVETGLDIYYADDTDEKIDGAFEIIDGDRYGFSIGEYQRSRTVIIDPLIYSTYFGGSENDNPSTVRIDDENNVYFSGHSRSTDFPTTPGSYNRVHTGDYDTFITKMNETGKKMLFSTFVGGTGYSTCHSLSIDDDHNVYFGGSTNSSDLPTTQDALRPDYCGGYWDGYITVLNSTGSGLVYSTFIGGSQKDRVIDIALGIDGSIFATGTTNSTDYHVTKDTYQDEFGGGFADVYYLKMNTSTFSLEFSSYLGASLEETVTSIRVDDNLNLFISGSTYSNDFPTSPNAYDDSFGGFFDSFVTSVSSNGSVLRFSTFLGGTDADLPREMVLDNDGNVILVGTTGSANFPTTSGVYQRTFKGTHDTFISKLSSNGNSLLTSTLFGTASTDFLIGTTLVVDENDFITIGGYSNAADVPTTEHASQKNSGGGTDSFVSRFNPSLSKLMHSTYLGGSEHDTINSIALIDPYTAWLLGDTRSSNFPVTNDAFRRTYQGGNRDAFLARMVVDIGIPVAKAGPDIQIDQHETVKFNGSGSSDNVAIINWSWVMAYDGDELRFYGPSSEFTFDIVGVYKVNLTVRDNLGYSDFDLMTVTVIDITLPIADAGLDISVSQYTEVDFDGTGSSDNVKVIEWLWNFTYQGEDQILIGPTPSFLFDDAGLYIVQLTVTDEIGLWGNDTLNVSVRDITAPKASIGPISIIDEHETVTFNGSLSSDNVGIANWTWTFVYDNSQIVRYGEWATFQFDIPGTYMVELIVRDHAGNLASDMVMVEVRDMTPPNADAGPDFEIPLGTTAFLNGTRSSDNLRIQEWTWTFEYESDDVTLEGEVVEYFFFKPGTYEIILNVTDRAGHFALDELVLTVMDVTPPEANAGIDKTIDQHQQVEFFGQSSSDNYGIAFYFWSFQYRDETITLNGPSALFVFDDAGVYNVSLEVLDHDGNSDIDYLLITVMDITSPFAIGGEDRTVDQGVLVELDASGSSDNVGITFWQWSFVYNGSKRLIDEQVGLFTFDIPGLYTLELSINDASGNWNSTSVELRVLDTFAPVPPTLKNRDVKLGEKVRFDASSASDNVGIVKWMWTFEEDGKTVTLEGQQTDRTFDISGEYEITLVVEDAEGNQGTTTFNVNFEESGSILIIVAIIIIIVLAVSLIIIKTRFTIGQGNSKQ